DAFIAAPSSVTILPIKAFNLSELTSMTLSMQCGAFTSNRALPDRGAIARAERGALGYPPVLYVWVHPARGRFNASAQTSPRVQRDPRPISSAADRRATAPQLPTNDARSPIYRVRAD